MHFSLGLDQKVAEELLEAAGHDLALDLQIILFFDDRLLVGVVKTKHIFVALAGRVDELSCVVFNGHDLLV